MGVTTDRLELAGGLVLVTGATGFIGRNVVAALLRAGARVRALSRSSQRTSTLGPVESHAGDLRDPLSLTGLEAGVDFVVHGAGALGTWGVPETELFETNVTGTLNLLDRFRETPLRRFVHLSAGGVTGPLRDGVADETCACRPTTAYERTKLQAERALLEESARFGIPVTVVRPTFTYGPGDPHKLPLFRAIQKGRYVLIGDGESVNHPVFIEDLVTGILLAASVARPGEIYIVGGERPVSKREMAHEIADALGVRRPGLRIPVAAAWPAAFALELLGRTIGFEPILTRSRVAMMSRNFGYSIEKARRELGYEPRVNLREGLARTVQSYREAGLL